MAYKFGEYVSTYVDPQSARISETLRNRFMENMQVNDQLAMAVDQMQAALPFENDVQRKRELQREMDNTLALLSERGDYENLGMSIRKGAKDFSEQYAPIKENYQRYSNYVNEFNEALKKGDYNAEQQKYLSQYMLRTAQGQYKGFEMDPETGRVKEGSLFTGPTIYKDPKIMDRVTERLKILHEEKTGSTVQKVGQGPGGMYVIEQGGTMSVIPQTKVDAVMKAVMAEPDVKAYVDQLSDMKTYSFQASGQLPAVFENQITGYKSAINQLNNMLSSGSLNSNERLQVKSQLATLNKELATLNKASGDEASMYAYIKSKAADEIIKPIEEYAGLKAGVYEQTSVYKESYDALWMDEYKRQKDFEEAYGTPMEEMSEITADLNGKTIEDQMTNARDKLALAAELEKEATDMGLSLQVRQEKLKQAANLKKQASLIEQNIIKAGDMAFTAADLQKTDSMIMDVVKDLYPGKSAGEYGLILKRVFDNPNDQDFMDFRQKFDSWHGRGAFDAYSVQNFNGMVQPNSRPEDIRVYNSNDEGAKQVFEKYGLGNLFGGANGAAVDYRSVFNTINSRFSIVNEGVTNKLKEVKIASPIIYGVLPGLTNEQSRIVTKAADAYFKDKSLTASMTVVDQESGETQSGKDLEQYSTKRYGYDTRTGDWVLTLEANVAGVKDIKTVRLSGNQVSNPIISNWQNAMPNQIALDVTKHDTGKKGDVREFSRNIVDKYTGERTGSDIKFRVHSEGPGQPPLVEIVDKTGYNYKKRSLSEFAYPPAESDRSQDAEERRTIYKLITEGYLE